MEKAPENFPHMLRQELRIQPGAPDVNGAPGWMLFDPVRHMFFRLGRVEFLIFTHWANNRLEALKLALEREGISGDDSDQALSDVVEFSLANNLVTRPAEGAVVAFSRQRRAMRKSWWRWSVDNYLFIRIPLVKPGAFLHRTLPRVEFLFSQASLVTFVLAGLLGLYLVSRQWDTFINSFLYFFSPTGLMAYALGIVVVKVIHELGHAYMATRFGCRVPAMGVAFLVMMPMLYTDTTAAWRLRSRRKRLLIDCAGMMAELGVAVISTLLWVALPDGQLRSVAFILATTGWLMSLAVNINPFMRFDGYYVLSDFTGIPNLQGRAFALGRWRLRELLFGLGDEPPEDLPLRTQRWMIVYAYATWIYRLILFVGIALLVYHFFFKLLGLILFVVEIIMFVARPIFQELKVWYGMRQRIKSTSRSRGVMIAGALLFLLLVLPLDRTISAPAVLSAVQSQPLVAGHPARLERLLVKNGQFVKAGTPVAVLEDMAIDREVARAKVRITQLGAQTGRATVDEEDRANLLVLNSDLAGERLTLAGLQAQHEKLTLIAPMDGIVVDISNDMTPGRWLAGNEPVAQIVSPAAYDIRGYVKEAELWRLEKGASARFVPNDPAQRSWSAELHETAGAASEHLSVEILGSLYGGPIAVTKDPEGGLKPREAIYPIRLFIDANQQQRPQLQQIVPGMVIIDAKPASPLLTFIRTIGREWHSF
ncbi:HlyD family efflux transporter periplasmic adaptor subunit [Pseudomonas sp. M30-35]|uniref:HlyD family efflux transporter periplasmic adaptor subunit n=1 Tax=Pseudomonas sp. M30-35 TaxID=1981174 RepID=UPI000B3D21C9|nr:HlyD family efflux transporter periplasmic adaptor subunit [Pseudomonas sp. M30-35]ARU86675.1 hypothetical protein B9K09_01135 [Pseudomonas sp. M30-35]